jgi:hypothetical protein
VLSPCRVARDRGSRCGSVGAPLELSARQRLDALEESGAGSTDCPQPRGGASGSWSPRCCSLSSAPVIVSTQRSRGSRTPPACARAAARRRRPRRPARGRSPDSPACRGPRSALSAVVAMSGHREGRRHPGPAELDRPRRRRRRGGASPPRPPAQIDRDLSEAVAAEQAEEGLRGAFESGDHGFAPLDVALRGSSARAMSVVTAGPGVLMIGCDEALQRGGQEVAAGRVGSAPARTASRAMRAGSDGLRPA